MELRELESAVEAILFAAGEPVPAERLAGALDVDGDTLCAVCTRLADHYSFERRGVRLLKLEESYQLCSAREYGELIRAVLETRRPAKLSQPALEALAIIAYYQPATRAYIDQIRGVDSSYTVGLLADRGLIEECGRLNVPGRPTLFRTTPAFLRTFGLASLGELPPLGDSEPGEQLDLLAKQSGGDAEQ